MRSHKYIYIYFYVYNVFSPLQLLPGDGNDTGRWNSYVIYKNKFVTQVMIQLKRIELQSTLIQSSATLIL